MNAQQQKVIEAIQNGGRVVFQESDARDLSASWLATLLGGHLKNVTIHPRGLSIENARIIGPVDWSHERFCRFEFLNCEFEFGILANNLRVDGEARFENSRITSLNLVDSSIGGDLDLRQLQVAEGASIEQRPSHLIDLTSASVKGSLHLHNTVVSGSMSLVGTEVGHQVNLQGVRLSKEGDWALVASDLKCGLDFRLDGSSVVGGLALTRARIAGGLFCDGATFSNEGQAALFAYQVEIAGSVTFSSSGGNPFNANGWISFEGSSIKSLLITGAHISTDKGFAFYAPNLKCDLDASLDNSTMNGGVYLMDAQIGGLLNFGGSTLVRSDGDVHVAADLHRIKVGTSIFFLDSKVTGFIDLNKAQIGSGLFCDGASFNNPGHATLDAYRARVMGKVTFDSSGGTPFSANGMIGFEGASIGSLSISGAQLSADNNYAFYAPNLKCELNAGLISSTINGGISLVDARIGGALSFDRSILTQIGEDGFAASFLHRIKVGASVIFRNSSVTGQIDLNKAQIASGLFCDGATFNNKGHNTLNAFQAEITGSVTFDLSGETPFNANGWIGFEDASIGSLSIADAKLSADNGYAFYAPKLKCDSNANLAASIINGGVSLMDAHIGGSLSFRGTALSKSSMMTNDTAVELHRVTIGVSVFFRKSIVDGNIDLITSKIGSGLYCDGATFRNQGGCALNAHEAEIGGSIYFVPSGETQFTAIGSIQFESASVGSLSFKASELHHEGGFALFAPNLKCSLDVSLAEVTIGGGVWLPDASIRGNLNLSGSIVKADDADGTAAGLHRAEVGKSVFLRNANVTGQIDLSDVKIGGGLFCDGATFTSPNGFALYAYQAEINGDADFGVLNEDPFRATGMILFIEASVTSLNMSNALLDNRNGPTLNGNRMKASGRVVLDGLNSTSRVSFIGASMGQLSVQGANLRLNNAVEVVDDADDFTDFETSTATVTYSHVVLSFELVKVRGGIKIGGGSSFSGSTVWLGAQVGGDFNVEDVSFLGGKEAFFANQLKVGGTFRLRNIDWGDGAKVSLRMATVMELDDLPNCYPMTRNEASPSGSYEIGIGTLDITGFVYQQFKDSSFNRNFESMVDGQEWTHVERLKWIARQTHQRNHDETTEGQYSPQPYLQLAEVYRQMGKDHERRKVLRRQQQDLREWGELSRPGKWWSRIVDILTGYGYESWRALVAIVLIYLLSVSLTTAVRDHGGLVATGNTASYVVSAHGEKAVQATSCTSYYPCNSSWLFPVDAAIPVINLHQSDFWSFNSANPWGDYGEILFSLLSILGWGFTSLLIAASAGLIKQN